MLSCRRHSHSQVGGGPWAQGPSVNLTRVLFSSFGHIVFPLKDLSLPVGLQLICHLDVTGATEPALAVKLTCTSSLAEILPSLFALFGRSKSSALGLVWPNAHPQPVPAALHNNPDGVLVCFCLFPSRNKEPSVSWVFLCVCMCQKKAGAREEANSSSDICGSQGPQWGGWVGKFEHA